MLNARPDLSGLPCLPRQTLLAGALCAETAAGLASPKLREGVVSCEMRLWLG
jgi:hypothetical protein